MITSRRNFLNYASKIGLASASAPLWLNLESARAFAQSSGSYKAIVLVSLPGGNDGNNTLIPMDAAEYNQYRSLRPAIAVNQGDVNLLSGTANGKTYGLHPALKNVAALYNQKKAAFVANVGPSPVIATKAQLLANPALLPASLLSHPTGLAQWESATSGPNPDTGWGGRLGDIIASQSGALPPVLDAGPSSVFTVGRSVQGIAVQANGEDLIALPSGIDNAILSIAQSDISSKNSLIAQAATLRLAAQKQQVLLNQAQAAGANISTQFPNSGFGNVMKTIAQVINGRSVVGASRQIFYCTQGAYDTHEQQWQFQNAYLSDLDAGLSAFMTALAEIGLADQVLICTHSDFNRTMQSNSTNGTDHAWGNHQMIVGGGIKGGRIFGTMPELELGGSSDLTGQGIWIPTTSVTQMTAGIGSWMGLNASQLSTVFPELGGFPGGPISLM